MCVSAHSNRTLGSPISPDVKCHVTPLRGSIRFWGRNYPDKVVKLLYTLHIPALINVMVEEHLLSKNVICWFPSCENLWKKLCESVAELWKFSHFYRLLLQQSYYNFANKSVQREEKLPVPNTT